MDQSRERARLPDPSPSILPSIYARSRAIMIEIDCSSPKIGEHGGDRDVFQARKEEPRLRRKKACASGADDRGRALGYRRPVSRARRFDLTPSKYPVGLSGV